MSKSIVSGLLTFAAVSSLLVAQDAPATTTSYSGGKGFQITQGDNFGLNISGFLQANFSYTNNEGAADTSTFNIPRSRLSFKGNAFSKDLLYFLQLDGSDSGSSGDGAIKEGHATWNFLSGDYIVGLRLGQGKCNYGFEGTGSSSGTMFTDTSMVTKAFANGYSRGAWLVGRGVGDRLRWTAGAMNTDVAAGLGTTYIDRGEETANGDNELTYAVTANYDMVGNMVKGNNEAFKQGAWGTGIAGTVGIGYAMGNGANNTGSATTPVRGEDIEATSINVNTAWNLESLQLMGEYFMRTDELQGATADEEESSGFHVLATYLLPKKEGSEMRWGLGLRYAMVETDEGATGSGVDFLTGARGIGSTLGEATEITAMVGAFYNQHNAKTVIEITKQDVEPDGGGDTTNYIVTLGFQVAF